MNSADPSPPGGQRKGLRGYITNQEFGGLRIPATVQTLVIRDYAARNNLPFELSVGEYYFPNCYVVLEGLLQQLRSLAGVGMCSLFMLPRERRKRQFIYDKFIEAGASLHLILESLVIRTSEDVERAEDIIRFKEVLAECPTSIPAELLPSIEGVDRFA